MPRSRSAAPPLSIPIFSLGDPASGWDIRSVALSVLLSSSPACAKVSIHGAGFETRLVFCRRDLLRCEAVTGEASVKARYRHEAQTTSEVGQARGLQRTNDGDSEGARESRQATRICEASRLALRCLVECGLHQLARHFVELRLKIFIVAGESLPERGQVHEAL
jgi:hypothetical protein